MIRILMKSSLNWTCSNHFIFRRLYSSFFLKPKNVLGKGQSSDHSKHPRKPARTRFAPSPTGVIHLGSLRTALYNYLLARNTGGQFLLRLEDTDQSRLVPGSEQNIYDSLKWAGLQWDEGPLVGGPFGPYRQSERADIYAQYARQLLDLGHTYRCFCTKDRLDALSQSAKALFPPSLASYDRKCSHLSRDESDERAAKGESFVIRLKCPDQYPRFDDLLHGNINLQTQVNPFEKRYDDPVLVKSDGLPTYHLANVIDDHLMKITHVIRGEEWLPSTPKHIALYQAFGWTPPSFIHIPLLTSTADRKLSKRMGDAGILSMAESKNILPEALVNFVALFGWSPVRRDSVGVPISEVFSLSELEKQFSLEGLTKGNAKVDDKKLVYFNNHYFKQRLEDPVHFDEIANKCHDLIQANLSAVSANNDIPVSTRISLDYTKKILFAIKPSISSPQDFVDRTPYLYASPDYSSEVSQTAKKIVLQDPLGCSQILDDLSHKFTTLPSDITANVAQSIINEILENHNQIPKKLAFNALRYALSAGSSGISVPIIISLLGRDISKSRLDSTLLNIKSSN